MNGNNGLALVWRTKTYAWLSCLAWTLLFGLAWYYWADQIRDTAVDLAEHEARASYEKDISYRAWASSHGGVYVPVTAETPPNKYLAGVKERDLTTPSGRKLTLMNPAYMTRQVHEMAKGRYTHRGHITSLKPIRPENKADEWETAALLSFEKGAAEVSEVIENTSGLSLRLMRPFITEQSCLRCHAAQGYKVGDIRGGISIIVDMHELDLMAKEQVLKMTWMQLPLWLAGIGGLVFFWRRLGVYLRQRDAAEAELELANRVLTDNQKEMESLLYSTTHDLRAPLVNIDGYSRLLVECAADAASAESKRTKPQLAGETEKNSRFLLGSVRRMQDLLESLLKVARAGRGGAAPTTLDMNAIFDEVKACMELELSKAGGTIEKEALPACFADPDHVKQILANLLDNALKYRSPERSLKIKITGAVKGRLCRYTVSDNGRGIQDHQGGKIWQLFYRADPENSPAGEGIGLPMARKLASANGGFLLSGRNADGGMDFILELHGKMK